jgi:uncharacterized protein (TIGR01440 family)
VEIVLDDLARRSGALAEELLAAAALSAGQMLAVGGSSSEIAGYRVGSAGNPDIGEAVIGAFIGRAEAAGCFLAVQGCEHINRALVVELEAVERYRLEPVNVVPRPRAGGALATAAYRLFREPVMVEAVQAHAGVDIGEVMIGMQIQPVAAPLRLTIRSLGAARVNAAKSRLKLIGGSRAEYLAPAHLR